MAVDWIKMRVDLLTHPKVVRVMSACNADRFRVIGGLFAVWSVFDAHTEDGFLDGYTLEMMDSIVGWPGFSRAMAAVGWLEETPQALVAPNFTEHNGRTAKRRATENQRKKEDRKTSAPEADKKRTREEKNSKPPISPPAGGRAVTFETFLEDCVSKNEKPISEYKPLLDYAQSISLPDEFLQLAWWEFKRIFGKGGVSEKKKYADWRRAFRNYIEKGYLKLWFVGANKEYELTTTGKQAQLAARERRAA